MLHYLYTPKPPFDSTLPKLIISVEQGSVVGLSWQVNDGLTDFMSEFSLSDKNAVLIFHVTKQLDEYFLGVRQQFNLPLKFVAGTEFQRQVWTQLSKIPYGQTISYKQLAEQLGRPTAYRAVANANGKNPISLVIPCHRVISNSGELGGYTGGVDIKRVLLELETGKSF